MNETTPAAPQKTAREILEDHAREHGVPISFETVHRTARNPWNPRRRAAMAKTYEARLAGAKADRAALLARVDAARAAFREASSTRDASAQRLAEVELRAWARELAKAETAERRAAERLAAMSEAAQVPVRGLDNIVGL